jgi:hypothetical protein
VQIWPKRYIDKGNGAAPHSRVLSRVDLYQEGASQPPLSTSLLRSVEHSMVLVVLAEVTVGEGGGLLGYNT